MSSHELGRRTFLGATAGSAALGMGGSAIGTGAGLFSGDDGPGLYTRTNFRALIGAVIPRTPELGEELGEEYVPGGLEVGLAEFMLTYVNNMFSMDLPFISEGGNLQMATPFAKVLDSAALKLLAKGDNESSPSMDFAFDLYDSESVSSIELYLKAGMFAKLAPRDRLRAIALLDELELELSLPGSTFFEFQAGMIGQLVIGFTEAVYYSEWEGYDDFWQPPSDRDHPNDPDAVQGWRQSEFPGFADGEAALRGYLGAPDSDLGAGQTWKTLDDGVEITLESGSFEDNDYDTSDYEEPVPPQSPPGDDDDDTDDDDSGEDDSGENPQDDDEHESGESPDDDDEDDSGWWF